MSHWPNEALGKRFRISAVEVVVRGYRNDLDLSKPAEPSVSSNCFDSPVAFSRRGTSAEQSFVQFVIKEHRRPVLKKSTIRGRLPLVMDVAVVMVVTQTRDTLTMTTPLVVPVT